jgi:mediator of RNA polymerase II transcription subunit 18
VNEFFVEGHRFVHKNMVLTLFRLLRTGDMPQQAPLTTLPSLDSLKPLDVSGAFVLEACVRIDDRTKPNLVSTASDELGAFRDLMKGSVDMKVPERLSLDTRVR